MKPAPTIAAFAAVLILAQLSPVLAGVCGDTSRKAGPDVISDVETKVKNNWSGNDVAIRISTRAKASDAWSVKKDWTTVKSGENNAKLFRGVKNRSFRVEIEADGETATCLYKTKKRKINRTNPFYSQAKFTWNGYSCSVPDESPITVGCEKSFNPPGTGSVKARWHTKFTVSAR